jgi:hypothetical protein
VKSAAAQVWVGLGFVMPILFVVFFAKMLPEAWVWPLVMLVAFGWLIGIYWFQKRGLLTLDS